MDRFQRLLLFQTPITLYVVFADTKNKALYGYTLKPLDVSIITSVILRWEPIIRIFKRAPN
jgi:hypothetical protein